MVEIKREKPRFTKSRCVDGGLNMNAKWHIALLPDFRKKYDLFFALQAMSSTIQASSVVYPVSDPWVRSQDRLGDGGSVSAERAEIFILIL